MIRIILLFLLIVSVGEATFFSYPLVAGLFTAVALVYGYESALLALVAGVWLDIFSFRMIGGSSLYFLTVCLVCGRYQRKIFSHNISYALVLLIVSLCGYYYLFFGVIYPLGLGISVSLSFVFFLLLHRWQPVGEGHTGLIHVRKRMV